MTDIDIPNRVMKVRSDKSPAVRWCPIFPELMPHLMRAKEMAAGGARKVQARYPVDMNLDKLFENCVKRAGLQPWQKPWQNLRASRETELMAHYPAKDVATWLGNSVNVAAQALPDAQPGIVPAGCTGGCTIPRTQQCTQDSAG